MFYQLPNSNLFTHCLLFFSREATSETYDPRVSFHHICLCELFSFAFIFISINPKIKKYLAPLFLYLFCFAFDLSIYYKFISRLFATLGAVPRKGLTTPLTRRVASICYLCAGAVYVVLLGSPTSSIPWFHNWRKYSTIIVLRPHMLSRWIECRS